MTQFVRIDYDNTAALMTTHSTGPIDSNEPVDFDLFEPVDSLPRGGSIQVRDLTVEYLEQSEDDIEQGLQWVCLFFTPQLRRIDKSDDLEWVNQIDFLTPESDPPFTLTNIS